MGRRRRRLRLGSHHPVSAVLAILGHVGALVPKLQAVASGREAISRCSQGAYSQWLQPPLPKAGDPPRESAASGHLGQVVDALPTLQAVASGREANGRHHAERRGGGHGLLGRHHSVGAEIGCLVYVGIRLATCRL